jgi:hypothetical protein
MPAMVALRYARGSRIAVISLTDAWKERQFAVCCRSRRALPRPAAELFNHLVAGADGRSPDPAQGPSEQEARLRP